MSWDNPLLGIDASLLRIDFTRQSTAPIYKLGFGVHSLAALIDHGTGIGGARLAVLMHPGNVRTNHADGDTPLLTIAYRTQPGLGRGADIGHRILVRTDGARDR